MATLRTAASRLRVRAHGGVLLVYARTGRAAGPIASHTASEKLISAASVASIFPNTASRAGAFKSELEVVFE